MTSQIIVRIDPELKKKVARLARAEGKNVSEVVRDLLGSYVKSRDIEGYIDELWDRIGLKLKKRRVTESDIDEVIQQVRAEE